MVLKLEVSFLISNNPVGCCLLGIGLILTVFHASRKCMFLHNCFNDKGNWRN